MKKLIPLAFALSLMMPLAHAQKKTDSPKEKPAAADKKKETKPVELSDSEKAQLADAKKEADALTPAQHAKLMELLNKGDAKSLEAVEGIGEVRAKNIIKKRPFAKAEDAAMVDDIGIETFKNLCASVKPVELSDSDKALLADAKKEADALTPAQHAKLMELLNKGDAKALQAVEGMGEVRVKNIIKKRPFAKAEDAAMVDGIGIETFKNLCASVKPAVKTDKPKTEEKKSEPPATKPEKPATKPEKPAAKPETPPVKPEKPAVPKKP